MARNCVDAGIDSFDLVDDGIHHYYRIVADVRDCCNWPVQIVDHRRFVVRQTVDTDFVGNSDCDDFGCDCMDDIGNLVESHDYCHCLLYQRLKNLKIRRFLAVQNSFFFNMRRLVGYLLFIYLFVYTLKYFGFDDNSEPLKHVAVKHKIYSSIPFFTCFSIDGSIGGTLWN